MSRLQTPIRKNDNVLVTTGKDRGKNGRVIQVVPEKNRLIVEGVNLIKRHTRPNPARTSRAASCSARRRSTRATSSWCAPSAGPIRASGTRCSTTAARSGSAASAREWWTNEPPEREVREGGRAGPEEGVRLRQRHGDPQGQQGDHQHGARRGDKQREDRRYRRGRAVEDHGPEGRRAPRQEVDCRLQGAPGHAGRRHGDAARRADVRVPRSPD